MHPNEVKALIEAALPCTAVEVEGDGHHFYATIVSPAFEGLKLLDRHRLVKDRLKAKLDSGELHALSLRATRTPAEAAP
ncbi:BolA family transcriptional regulator [Chitiniphilus shinanonensis]|uniref:BolA family transcriptional regulator n=1 Tax=Chitiniphilus shinanonensis TaxID=553088 RepID=A0ABQ6BWD7_9NEIS|nr:BolA/IbaG family iron-sulfur metabolism protein [Chitiniphilus shinanonensis]GLS04218.1 BolA family transcriptional regulator [Chitiniphilus shinanonensis]